MKEGCWHNGRMALVLLLMSSYLNHWRQKQWTVMGQYKPSQALVLHVRAHLVVGIPRVLACCLSHGGKNMGPRESTGCSPRCVPLPKGSRVSFPVRVSPGPCLRYFAHLPKKPPGTSLFGQPGPPGTLSQF